MKKKDLQESVSLTQHAMRKLSKDEAVTTDTLAKICRCLNCSVDEIMDEFLYIRTVKGLEDILI